MGDKVATDRPRDRPSISRRAVLAGSGTLAMGFAGCTIGGPGDDGDDGDDDDGDGDGDNEIVGSIGRLPETEMQWNPYNTHYPWTFGNWAYEFGAKSFTTGEVRMMGVDGYDYDEDSLELDVHLRDDLVFWNGEQYTGEDLYTFEEFDRLLFPDASNYESIEVVDDTTVKFTYKERRNPELIERVDLPTQLERHRETWGEWLERAQDAANQDELEEIEADIGNTRIEMQEFVDNGLGTGSYVVTEFSDDHMVLEPNEDHRFYDEIEFDSLRLLVCQEEACDQLVTNGEVEFGNSPFPQKYEGAAPEYFETVARYGAKWLWHMVIAPHHTEALQDRNFRRAMAAAINTEDVVTNQEAGFPIEAWSGMDPQSHENLWGDQLGDFIDYKPQEKDHELADQFLERSDYSREDGTVYRPDGEEMETIEFIAQTVDVYFSPAETAANQLQEYGFNIDFVTMERDQAIDRYQGNADFGLTVESQYAGATGHPISYFVPDHRFGYYLADAETANDVESWLDDGLETSPFNGKPLRPEIPAEVGVMSPDEASDTERVNVYELYNEVFRIDDEERTEEILKKLSWMYNFDLPSVSLMQREQGSWGNTQDFDWPAEEEMMTYRGAFKAIKQGETKPA